jgi:hypothetical protein
MIAVHEVKVSRAAIKIVPNSTKNKINEKKNLDTKQCPGISSKEPQILLNPKTFHFTHRGESKIPKNKAKAQVLTRSPIITHKLLINVSHEAGDMALVSYVGFKITTCYR